jgi:lipid-A-disaccharide synthase
MQPKILVSAGEASGDLYASLVVAEIRREWPDAEFFGCTGPRLREAGVRTVVDTASLAVVGLAEVVAHIPRIYREFRKLMEAAERERPALALLTDSPDFHLRAARKLHGMGIPVAYLVAPQAWAWREGRVKEMRRTVRHLMCIFPFEQDFFESRGVTTTYIGHPLSSLVKPSVDRDEFFRKHRLPLNRPLIAVLPGSRRGEAARHLPVLADAIAGMNAEEACTFLLPASATTGKAFFEERLGNTPIQVLEGESWDAMAHADVALAASGTVTVEAALLGTPMVTFYKVSRATWFLGRPLVKVPFYSMVNLIAGRKIAPELIQDDMTPAAIAAEARKLLTDPAAALAQKAGLAEVRDRLSGGNAPVRAATIIHQILEGQFAHAS